MLKHHAISSLPARRRDVHCPEGQKMSSEILNHT